MDIILYLLLFIQYQHKQICWLFNFICRYIPLKQWVFDDSHSPKYQKFKIDKLPKIIYYEKWDYKDYIPYLEWRVWQRKSNLSAAVLNVILMTTVTVHVAMLQSLISYKNNGIQKDRSCAKYVSTAFSRKKTVFQSPTPSNARTAITRWLIRKTANTLLSTNVNPNVLTTSTI